MFGFLQVNLRKSGSARRMLEQTSMELGSDLLIMSEIPKGSQDTARWISSSDRTAAVALSNTAFTAPTSYGRGLGYALMQFPDLLV